MEINLKNLVGPSFHPLINPVLDNEISELFLTGGRCSLKSSFMGVIIPFAMMEDYFLRGEVTHAMAIRKVANTLKDSVFSQIEWGLNLLGVRDDWILTKSPLKMIFKPSGQQILFNGCDDPTKIKSTKVPTGYLKYRWFEEFDQFSNMEEIRNINQSLARGGKTIGFYSFNPPPMPQHWANIECDVEREYRLKHHSTWETAPKHWIGPDFIRDALHLKQKNFKAYQNEYLGLVTGVGGEIFKNVRNVSLTDEDILQFDKIRQGLDFGFTVDPSAFVKLCYSRKHNGIWLFDQVFEYEMSTKELSKIVNKKCSKYETIKGDSAELRTINTMNTEYLVNISACKKGPDSVRHGIKFLQDLDFINIDKKRCPDAYREFGCYQYKKNKQGIFIKEYPDEDNHTIDATRYSLDDIILKSGWRVQSNKR